MGAFFIFNLKASVCLVAFYLFYKLLLSRETFHHFNRFAMLTIVLLSLIVPLIQTTTSNTSGVSRGVATVEAFFVGQPAAASATAAASTNSLPKLLLILYIAGMVTFAAREALSLIRLRRLIGQGREETLEGDIHMVVMPYDIAPFSYLNYVIVDEEDATVNRRTILAHELAHIALHHSTDIVVANMLTIVQWFNPAAWLLKRELQNVHEFEADQAVLHQGVDATSYQLLLVRKSVGDHLFSMANTLTHHTLKRRIAMMMAPKSNPRQRLRLLYVVPVAVLAVAVFANPQVKQATQQFETMSDQLVDTAASVAQIPQAKELAATTTAPTAKSTDTDQGTQTLLVDTAEGELPEPDVTASDVSAATQGGTNEYEASERPPSFQGGAKDLNNYLSTHIKYPPDAWTRHIQGGVSVLVTLSETGKVINVKIVHSANHMLNAEAIRVVKSMPNWNPGYLNGKPTQVTCGFQINFNLKPENPGKTENSEKTEKSDISE
jgi:TonB family protein